jgi:hypothetical protein
MSRRNAFLRCFFSQGRETIFEELFLKTLFGVKKLFEIIQNFDFLPHKTFYEDNRCQRISLCLQPVTLPENEQIHPIFPHFFVLLPIFVFLTRRHQSSTEA